MNKNLSAGKGFQSPMTEEFLSWLTATMVEIEDALGMESTYIRPEEVKEELIKRFSGLEGWEYQDDKFGPRMVAAFGDEDDPDAGEVRVAVIYYRGIFKIDIRNWYLP